MQILKMIFSVGTLIFVFLGLTQILPDDISSPIMFVFLGLTLLVRAKECKDKEKRKDAVTYLCLAILVNVYTAYNLLSKVF